MSAVHLGGSRVWAAAIVGGLVGGIGMGALLQSTTNAMPVIGALYGQPTLVGGWLAHLFNSVVFALVFAGAVTLTPLREYAEGISTCTGLGLGYGALLGIVASGVILPLALTLAGATALPVARWPLPGVAFGTVFAVSHLVYGLGVGVAFGAVTQMLLPAGTEQEAAVEH